MPTYDFCCKKCKHNFEDIVFNASDVIKCPKCNSKKTEKLLSAPVGLVFDKPQESSKWDNFGFRAGFNMNKAKEERRAVEKNPLHHKYKSPEETF